MKLNNNISTVGQTRILTTEGFFSISRLVDKTITFWYKNNWVTGTVFKHKKTTKPIPMYILIYSTEVFVTCRADHNITLEDGRVVSAEEINVGDKLFHVKYPILEGYKELDVEQAYLYGYNFLAIDNKSELVLHNLNNYTAKQRYKLMYTKLKKKASFIPNKEIGFYPNTLSLLDVDAIKKDIQQLIEEESQIDGYKYIDYKHSILLNTTFTARSRMAWVAGVFDALGKYENGVVTIKAQVPVALYNIKNVLLTLGCVANVIKTSEKEYTLIACASTLVEIGVPFLVMKTTNKTDEKYDPITFVIAKEKITDKEIVNYGIKQVSV